MTQAKSKNKPLIIALAVIVVACLAGGIAGGTYLVNTYSQISDVENSRAMEPTLPTEMTANQSNPINFDALYEQNIDIYAWIYLPGTPINYPVCQNDDDDAYYLNHNAVDEESELGAIFSEHQFNGVNFQDPVTILYGHYGFGDAMFTALHQFERDDFFNEHDKVYIYTPGHVYTYKIFSAFMSDDRHLMGLYNFRSEDGLSKFVADMSNPNAIGANTRSVKTSAGDKFLVLSTCNAGVLESTGRYLVCGVMVDDFETK